MDPEFLPQTYPEPHPIGLSEPRTIDDAKWRRSAWHALGRPSIGADGASAMLQSSVLEDGLSIFDLGSWVYTKEKVGLGPYFF